MLLITAILFVKIAQSIPVPQTTSGSGGSILSQGLTPPTTPDNFYRWMAIMLFIDVGILAVDGIKSWLLGIQSPAQAVAYSKWVVFNFGLGIICWFAPSVPGLLPSLSELATSIIVFACAFLRTVADYITGKDWMFP